MNSFYDRTHSNANEIADILTARHRHGCIGRIHSKPFYLSRRMDAESVYLLLISRATRSPIKFADDGWQQMLCGERLLSICPRR